VNFQALSRCEPSSSNGRNKGGEVIMPWDEQAEDNPTFAFALLAARCRNHAFRSKA
jgi:hypothetical protein